MGKSTISMAIFNGFLYVYQRVADIINYYIPIYPIENKMWSMLSPSNLLRAQHSHSTTSKTHQADLTHSPKLTMNQLPSGNLTWLW